MLWRLDIGIHGASTPQKTNSHILGTVEAEKNQMELDNLGAGLQDGHQTGVPLLQVLP